MNNRGRSSGNVPSPPSIGSHHVWDLLEVQPGPLKDRKRVVKLLERAIEKGELHPVQDPVVHKFPEKGNGITAFVILQESHICLHTYPERGYMGLEVFACGELNPEKVVSVFVEDLSPGTVTSDLLDRGTREEDVTDT